MKKILLIIFIFFSIDAQSYPASRGNNTNYEWITNVTLENINYSTSAGSGYDDFTNISTDLLTNTTYTLSVTIHVDQNNPHEYINAWIDWNDDGDFNDNGEKYTLVVDTQQDGPHTININSGNHVGELRMRVSIKWNSEPDNDENFTYGEVEDYTINTYKWRLATLGNWDSDGVPDYLESTGDVVTDSEVDSLLGTYSNASTTPRVYLNAGKDLTTFNSTFIQTTDIELTTHDSVWVTFITESAGNKNTLGFYTYTIDPTNINDIDTMTLIYPNSSSSDAGDPLVAGNRVYIGSFPSGTKIGWCLFSNAWVSDSTSFVDRLPNWTNSYYSKSDFNPSNYDHTAIFKYKRYDKWVLSFEDLSLGDKDYADVLYWVTTSSGNFTPLPVELLSYDYNYKTQNLEWVTASEENNDFFTITVFEKDGTIVNTYYVDGAGNSNILLKYQLNIIENDVYVHATQTDYDGKRNDLFTTYIRQQKQKIYLINNINHIEINGVFNEIQIINMNGVEIPYNIINNKVYGLKRGFYIFIIDETPYKVVY